jgi:hypothetical protein
MPSVIFLFPQNEESGVLAASAMIFAASSAAAAGSKPAPNVTATASASGAAVFHDLCMCSSSFVSLSARFEQVHLPNPHRLSRRRDRFLSRS